MFQKGWNSLFWNNHDLPRIVSRWGNDGRYRVESAKMLAAVLHGMQGTPYIYQGEELGMTNIRLPIEQYVDIEIHGMYAERIARGDNPADVMASIYAKGRDNARTPMQWSDGENAGFTTGAPWLPANPNYREINAAAALSDLDSVFYYYQKLIRLRKEHPIFREGDFELVDAKSEQTFAYLRRTENETLLVACNFTGETVPFVWPEGFGESALLISNCGEPENGTLRPYEAFMLLGRR